MSQLQNQRTRKSYSIARRRSILTGSGSSSSKKVWLRLHNTAHGHQLAYCRPLSRTMLVACDITNWCHSAASLVKMTKFQPNPNSQTQIAKPNTSLFGCSPQHFLPSPYSVLQSRQSQRNRLQRRSLTSHHSLWKWPTPPHPSLLKPAFLYCCHQPISTPSIICPSPSHQ